MFFCVCICLGSFNSMNWDISRKFLFLCNYCFNVYYCYVITFIHACNITVPFFYYYCYNLSL